MTTAIHYSPVKAPAEAGQVFGLQVAVLDWLRAYLHYSKQEKFPFLISDEAGLREVREVAASINVDVDRLLPYDGRFPRENFGTFSTIFRIDPDPHHILWQRALSPDLNFAFCGLAHAIAGLEGGSTLEKYCLGPSAAHDAIICPSRAVKAAIQSFWDSYGDYIEQRFGAKFQCAVQLPIIPLGTDTERMAVKVIPTKRAAQRTKLGLNEKDIVVLWVGRLSYAIKAHPLAMFRAAEEAAKKTGVPVHFIMVGYFMPAEAAKQFQDMAHDFCPTAKVSFIASDDKRFPDGLWAAADIFLSLVDNMQESFGLTPIEAIAAGLPRVLSDWDGYRDSVTHGEDGFLIPSHQPPPGTGGDLSAVLLGGREVYSGFLAKTALSVVVDHHAAAEVLISLIENPELRRRVADNAKRRLKDYDWQQIIPAYESLWAELAFKRVADNRQWPAIPPQAPDPFTMYAAYPTAPLKVTDTLSLIANEAEINLLLRHEINKLALDMTIGLDDLLRMLKWLGLQNRPTIGQLLVQFPSLDKARIWRTVGWLAKLGIVHIV